LNPSNLAFPAPAGTVHAGISVRTYIATAALQGLLACDSVNASSADCAKAAVVCADALIAELNK
jgi:hypothetical protein